MVTVLEVIVGIGAIFGGGLLIAAPDGHLLGVPTRILAGTPFDSFLVPGIVLFTAVGVLPLAAAAMTLRTSPHGPLAAVIVGLLLVGWITAEMVILGGPQTLAWALYLVLGTVIATLGVVWARSSISSVGDS